MAQTRPSPTLSRGFTHLGRFLAPYGSSTPAAWQDQGARMTVIALANAVKSHRTKTFVSSLTS